MAAGTFPKPYLNDMKESDPMIIRAPRDNMEIGARPGALPKLDKNGMTIGHVGGTTGKGG